MGTRCSTHALVLCLTLAWLLSGPALTVTVAASVSQAVHLSLAIMRSSGRVSGRKAHTNCAGPSH